MKITQYAHIAAWCRVNEIGTIARLKMQRLAAEDNAPLDALYLFNGVWRTYGDVGKRTQMALDIELNRGA